MPLAGFISTQSKLSLPWVILAGTVGSVLGAIPLYYLGHCAGEDRLRRWAKRHGRWIGISVKDLDKSKIWFERHGGKTVLLCRLIPGVRSLISIPAGFVRMNFATFLVYTTIGSAVWSGVLAGAGRALGSNYGKIEHVIGPISTAVVAGIVLTLIVRGIRQSRAAH
jgi:membrane protein DedA with SNARE-associated domain